MFEWVAIIVIVLWFAIMVPLIIMSTNRMVGVNTSKNKYEVIMAHTYCPKHSRVPYRGQLVVTRACDEARAQNVPLILAVGNTVPTDERTEAKIYQDFIVNELDGDDLEIILGQNSLATSTASETKEAARICRDRGFSRIAVCALEPHMMRVQKFWKQYSNEFHVDFLPVTGPLKYHYWEFCMLILERLLPQDSARRKFVLDMIGRRGKKKN
jgi:hypothetical protein